MELHELEVGEPSEGLRLDTFLTMCGRVDHSRSYLSTLVSNGHVTVDGEVETKPARKVRAGQTVVLSVPDPEPIDLSPQQIELDVVYEDDHLLVVNKQPDLVMHPAPTCRSGTLVNALLAHCTRLSGISGELRPGIVHRLDRDTTGLVMVAKDDRTHRMLSSQLSARTVKRRYVALVWGRPPRERGRIDAPIGRDLVNRQRMAVTGSGKRAVTNYGLLAAYRLASMVECRLETGRTHQIRVHMADVCGCPVIADAKYGGCSPRGIPSGSAARELVGQVLEAAGHQMLHAETLGFLHPETGEEMEFHQAPPVEFSIARRLLERFPGD